MISLSEISKIESKIDFPPVIVDQTNCRISDIIRKNQAGEQVMGVKNLQFDYRFDDKNADFEKVNPFSGLNFDLDDVITLAERTGQAVTDLQNRQGELKAQIDQARSEEPAFAAPAPQAPAAPAAPATT